MESAETETGKQLWKIFMYFATNKRKSMARMHKTGIETIVLLFFRLKKSCLRFLYLLGGETFVQLAFVYLVCKLYEENLSIGRVFIF